MPNMQTKKCLATQGVPPRREKRYWADEEGYDAAETCLETQTAMAATHPSRQRSEYALTHMQIRL